LSTVTTLELEDRMEYRTLPERLVTAEDYLHMADEDGWVTELEEGRVVREPYPGPPHGQAQAEIIARLRDHVRQHHVGVVFGQCGFKLRSNPDTVRGPDAAFVSTERTPPDGIPKKFLTFGPDLAVEIISPTNKSRDIMRKVLEYLTAGSQLVWVMDPELRTVTVYPGREHIRILEADDELDGSPVLPGFKVRVGDLLP
jgi:Uma2 family endonuclease